MNTILPTIESAEKRFAKHFTILDKLNSILSEIIDNGRLILNKQPDRFLQTHFLIRSYNIYKCIIQLLKIDHWEQGLILARSIFELLLNCEYVFKSEETKAERVVTFLRFHKLQEYLALKNMAKYEETTGRTIRPERLQALNKLDELSLKLFPDFLDKNNKWIRNWNRKSVANMAIGSPMKMRKIHYDFLYSLLSSYAHGTPQSVLTTFTEINDDIDIAAIKEPAEEMMLVLTISMSISWLLEIAILCGDAIDKIDMLKILAFAKEFKDYMQAFYPDVLPAKI